MALQKKQYRSSTNRSRGGGLTTMARSPYRKDYGNNVRACHGPNTDKVQDALAKQIAHKKKYG